MVNAPFAESQQRFRSIVRSGDFNGDGRVDLLVRAEQGLYCGKNCTNWVNRWLAKDRLRAIALAQSSGLPRASSSAKTWIRQSRPV